MPWKRICFKNLKEKKKYELFERFSCMGNHIMIQNVDFGFFFLLALVLSGNRSYEPGTLRLSNHTNTEQFFWFSLLVFRQAGPLQRVDC